MKRLTSNKQIHNGAKVKLLEETEYVARMSNPKIGSEYECSGVVIDYDELNPPRTMHHIQVRWENGSLNTYRLNDLGIVNDEFISIWDNSEPEIDLDQ